MLVSCLVFSSFAGMVSANSDYFDDSGYRGIPYKAPTPLSIPGGRTIHFAEDVLSLIENTRIVPINVSPITLAPPDKSGKRLWIPQKDKIMQHIPGSVWLPNVGYQTLDPIMLNYLETNLKQLTGGDKKRALLFYCTSDCWMSWNTVKRVTEVLDYENIYWYPSGIDGWIEQELPLEDAVPVDISNW